MIDRVDLLIAVVGIMVSVVGSSTAMWMTLNKKADKDDLARVEGRLDAKIDRVDAKIDRVGAKIDRVETKLDGLIMRFVPDRLENPGQ